eukprot:3284316-Prymnesium_polylepis.2
MREGSSEVEKREAAIYIGQMSANNSLVADMWLIDGAVRTMKHAATQEWGAELRPVRAYTNSRERSSDHDRFARRASVQAAWHRPSTARTD